MPEGRMEENQKAFEEFCGQVFQVSRCGNSSRIVSISEYVKRTGIPRQRLEAVCQALGLVVKAGRGPFGYTTRLP